MKNRSVQRRKRAAEPRRTGRYSDPGVRYRVLQTPTGRFAILQLANGEVQTTWIKKDEDVLRGGVEDRELLPGLAVALTAYFAGRKAEFSGVATPRGSRFYSACWQACRAIPRGRTISYGELAARAGSPGAARAAGQAMRNNPLPIVVPCHRVIGTSGSLHGFGGTCDSRSPELRRKRMLLELESHGGR